MPDNLERERNRTAIIFVLFLIFLFGMLYADTRIAKGPAVSDPYMLIEDCCIV